MALLEVVQAKIKDWKPLSKSEETGIRASGIYLRVQCAATRYTERIVFCCVRSLVDDVERPEAFTHAVEEQREILWQRRTEDNFLTTLLTFIEGGQVMKLKCGEQVNFIAEAFRIPLREEVGKEGANLEEGESIAIFQAIVRLNIGDLTLKHKSAGMPDNEGIKPSLVLALRPRCTRPFHLEYARPDGGSTTMSIHAPDALGRVPKTSQSSSAGTPEQPPSPRHIPRRGWDRAFPGRDNLYFTSEHSIDQVDLGRNPRGAGTPCLTGTYSDADSVLKERVSGESAESSTESLAHEMTSPNSPSWAKRNLSKKSGTAARGSGGYLDVLRPQTTDRSESQISYSECPPSPTLTGTEGDGIVQHWSSSRLAGIRSKAKLKRSLTSLVGKIVSKRVTSYADKRDEDVPITYNRWVPTKAEWPECWKSPWVAEDDQLAEGIDVVPLMEAEFRRDCIIFFNTLFPRTQGKTFRQLRDLALNPAEASQITFKLIEERGRERMRTSLLPYTRDWLNSWTMDTQYEDDWSPPSLEGKDRSSCQKWVARARHVLSPRKASHRAYSPQAFSPRTITPAEPSFAPTASDGSVSDDAPVTCEEDGILQHSFGSQPFMSLLANPRGTFVDEYSPRIMFLKRLFLGFAACGVHYSEVSRRFTTARELWPYPLASILGHGSRVLIRLEDVSPSEFINFLLFGDPHHVDWKENGIPYPVKPRLAATHAVALEPETGDLVETRLQVTSVKDNAKNISDGMRKRHLGLDMPIGGVGNPSPLGDGFVVDFTGRVVQLITEDSRKRSKFRSAFRRSPWQSQELATSAEEQGEAGSSGGENSMPVGSVNSMRFTEQNGTISSQVADGARLNAKVAHGLQGGHIYMRIDDFGPQVIRAGVSDGRIASWREERRRNLNEPPRDYVVPLEQAQLRARMQHQSHLAGEVFFSSAVPVLHVRQRQRLFEKPPEHAGPSGKGVKILRMKSEPTIPRFQAHASREDVKWVKEMIVNNTPAVALRVPPSPAALRLLLEHYDPLHTQLLGKCGFGSVQEFFHEVKEHKVFLMKRGAGIIRYVEPVVLQLRYRGHLLVQTHQQTISPEGDDAVIPKNFLLSTKMAPEERWHDVLMKAIASKLKLSPKVLMEAITSESHDEGSHTVMEEARRSPSYPGLLSYYRTHFIEWELTDDNPFLLGKLGLPIDDRARLTKPKRCDFETNWVKLSGSSRKGRPLKSFWRWIPEHTARQHVRFWNIGTKTADERWARYALQKEGIVQYPPTCRSLMLLLSRCGVDTSQFGEESGRKSVQELWTELLNGGSCLQMSKGYPLRVAETLFVRLRWRGRPSRRSSVAQNEQFEWHILLKSVTELKFQQNWMSTDERVEEEIVHDTSQSQELLHTRKLPDENWKEAAMRCLSQELHLTHHEVSVLVGLKENAKSGGDWMGPMRIEDDAPMHTSFDQIRTSSSYPGVRTLYRTHLVTFQVREDHWSPLDWRALFGHTAHARSRLPMLPKDARLQASSKGSHSDPIAAAEPQKWLPIRSSISSWTSTGRTSTVPAFRRSRTNSLSRPGAFTHAEKPESRSFEEPTRKNLAYSRRVSASTEISKDSTDARATAANISEVAGLPTTNISGPQKGTCDDLRTYTEGMDSKSKQNNGFVNFSWMKESQAGAEVYGMQYFTGGAQRGEAKHHVHSVLIGLEGSAPNKRSPFGTEHDVGAKSNHLSAVGGRKWRAYRLNNALQIPSDDDGMHMKITRHTFEELVKTCDDIGLMDPATDLVNAGEGEQAYTREVLDQRYAEKEIFKQILGGSAAQAMQLVEWMKEQFRSHKTPTRAYAAITRRQKGNYLYANIKSSDQLPSTKDSDSKCSEHKESSYSLESSRLHSAEACITANIDGSELAVPQLLSTEASCINANTEAPYISI